MQPDNLHSLKDDMIAFIEGHGMRRLPGFVMEDVASVLWEDEQNPDSWKDFVEMAKAAQAPFITMSDITLEKEDLQSLLEDLRDFNFPDEVPDSEEAEVPGELRRQDRLRAARLRPPGHHVPARKLDRVVRPLPATARIARERRRHRHRRGRGRRVRRPA